MGGGILDIKSKNAFTLIELLAIIVILAIIAVITVPIILNIIENSRMGAATDSAYGYKDAVNKWYVTKLQEDNQFQLDSSYTISSDGKLGDIVIPISGDKPSGGYLNYSNNTLQGGCLVIGDYAVTFEGGNATSTIKGDCSSSSNNSGNEQGNGGQSSSVPTIASCPGCKFIFTTDSSYSIVGSNLDYDEYSDMPAAADLTNDYTTLIGEGGHPYFLGLIESAETPGKIGRAFACGIENNTPFCLEGYVASKWSDNVGILNDILGCGASASNSEAYCNGSSVEASAYDYGDVSVYGDVGYCYVHYDGDIYCSE